MRVTGIFADGELDGSQCRLAATVAARGYSFLWGAKLRGSSRALRILRKAVQFLWHVAVPVPSIGSGV